MTVVSLRRLKPAPPRETQGVVWWPVVRGAVIEWRSGGPAGPISRYLPTRCASP